MKPELFLDALLSLPKLYSPNVSRGGNYVAWTWAQVGPTADIFVASTDGVSAPTRLTRTAHDTWMISWTPDDQAVIVAQDKDGNERYQLFRVLLDQPEEMEPLTEANPNFFLRGGQLHPNGRWLIYAANYDSILDEEIEATWVYRHDLESGERFPIAKPSNPSFVIPRMNQQGTHILYTRKDLHPSGEQIWLADIDGNEDHEILNFGDATKVFASWFPDGENAVVLSERETHRKVGVWNRITEDLKWLIDDPERNFEIVFTPKNTDKIVALEVHQARLSPSLIDPESGEEWHVPKIPQNLIPLAPVEGKLPHGDWIVKVYDSSQPVDLVRLPLKIPSPEDSVSLTRVWDHTPIKPIHLVKAKDFRWESEDGLGIQGWLYRSQTPPIGTVIIVHGGPTYHSEDILDIQIQFLVSQGFNVLTPNYRGSTGFDLAFQESIKEEGWGGKEQVDITTGMQALINARMSEPGKIGITGTSFGGYSSWCAITRNPKELVAAAAPVCGMTDLVVDYETTRPDLRPYSEEMMGGTPDEVPDRYYARSPINFVDRIEGKLLIVQGSQDPNVTPENVRQVRRDLEKSSIKYDLLAFDDEGHGIFRPKNLKILYLRLAEFFKEAFEGS